MCRDNVAVLEEGGEPRCGGCHHGGRSTEARFSPSSLILPDNSSVLTCKHCGCGISHVKPRRRNERLHF